MIRFDTAFKPGQHVQDEMSGLKGYISSIRVSLHGPLMLGIQPKSEEGDKLIDAWSVDQHLLKLLDAGLSDRCVPVPVVEDLSLGEEVQDEVSGTKGIATAAIAFSNGCVHIEVQPRKGRLAKEPPGLHFYPYQRLKPIGSGVTKGKAATKAAEDKNAVPPGGPSIRMAGNRAPRM